MSVYRKFDRNDILSTVVHTAPRVLLASGSAGPSGSINGWRGNVGTSSSLSLYGGVRGRTDARTGTQVAIYPLDPVNTHSIDKVIYVSGSYPSTGSVQFVKVRRAPYSSFQQVNHENWYQEHFSPVELLFDYYSQFHTSFFTGSYDYKSLYLSSSNPTTASCVAYTASLFSEITTEYTLEAIIKPTRVSGSQDFTIHSQGSRFAFSIDGTTRKLQLSNGAGVMVSSSAEITPGVWQHVAATFDSLTASLYIDGSAVGAVANTVIPSGTSGPLYVGAQVSGTTETDGFAGYIFESRIWNVKRTPAELSSSLTRTLWESGSLDNLVHYSRFNDGPLSDAHGFTRGSGAFDYSLNADHGQFLNVDIGLPRAPIWQPNDNPDFVTKKTQVNTPIDMFKVVHVPSMFYGRQIATGSVQLVCNSYNSQGITRVIVDDGRGGLYLSGSATRNLSGEDYAGVSWNKVGNVFYTEGLIVITDPSLLDFGEVDKDWSGSPDLLSVKFDGVNRIPSKIISCRLGTAVANGSRNPSYTSYDTRGDEDPSNDRLVLEGDPTTWVSSVGIYDKDRNLVAVAKLASPIRKREKDKITIRLRLDI